MTAVRPGLSQPEWLGDPVSGFHLWPVDPEWASPTSTGLPRPQRDSRRAAWGGGGLLIGTRHAWHFRGSGAVQPPLEKSQAFRSGL